MIIENQTHRVGAVVIGRNEGQRLVTCLSTLIKQVEQIIYVDSGSIDSSVQEAKKMGVTTVSLDMSQPFTAARARNEGARHLLSLFPEITMIQFVDGDCEVVGGWIASAVEFLSTNAQYAAVCGRRRERYPEKTVYNKLCDIEWNTPVGTVMACGGDALVRAEAFQEVNGYREDLIAGEEPEMCFRLRACGWSIYRYNAEMTLHDAAITKISQWWKRTVRAGYAYAQGSAIHGKSAERFWVREKQRIIVWGISLPLVSMILSSVDLLFANLLLLYFVQAARVAASRKDLGSTRFLWAISIVLGKFPEANGLLLFYFSQLKSKKINIIEYK